MHSLSKVLSCLVFCHIFSSVDLATCQEKSSGVYKCTINHFQVAEIHGQHISFTKSVFKFCVSPCIFVGGFGNVLGKVFFVLLAAVEQRLLKR